MGYAAASHTSAARTYGRLLGTALRTISWQPSGEPLAKVLTQPRGPELHATYLRHRKAQPPPPPPCGATRAW